MQLHSANCGSATSPEMFGSGISEYKVPIHTASFHGGKVVLSPAKVLLCVTMPFAHMQAGNPALADLAL